MSLSLPDGSPVNHPEPSRVAAELYTALLGREGNEDEIGPYGEFLAAGGSIHGVVAQILDSAECQLTFMRNPSFRKLVAPDPIPGDVPRLYVWHIPKTAGTSLREMLMPHFEPLEFCESITLSELQRLSPARLHSFRVIAGHFGPMLPPLLTDVPLVTVTLVREPEAIVPSIYCQWRDHGPVGHPVTELTQRLSFDEWCRRDDLRGLWSNSQARSLALARTVSPWPGPNESPEGEGPPADAIDDAELRTLALSLFDGIDIVGTSEDLLPVYRTSLDRLAVASGEGSELRVNVSSGLKQSVSPDTRNWIRQHNQLDAELLDRARDRRHELLLSASITG